MSKIRQGFFIVIHVILLFLSKCGKEFTPSAVVLQNVFHYQKSTNLFADSRFNGTNLNHIFSI
ncbi:hypothetical protein FXB83_01410 [Aggregatibacter actinomycetemcomitans]|nr:hypothetical protein FXB83_01410 [Aggregatibacter actinomycetemcomitans]